MKKTESEEDRIFKPPESPHSQAGAEKALKGITDKPIKFVLNTHFHGDHTGGNAQFSSEAPIIAQENVRKRLKEGGMVAGTEVKPASKEALPVITFNDRATVHLNGEDIRAIHFPNGHTDGDSVIFFPQSNVVHMADDFVTYDFPFVDVRSGGSVSGMIAGVEKVLSMTPPDAKIIPGHGPLATPADVRKLVQMLKETRALVTQAAAQSPRQPPPHAKKATSTPSLLPGPAMSPTQFCFAVQVFEQLGIQLITMSSVRTFQPVCSMKAMFSLAKRMA